MLEQVSRAERCQRPLKMSTQSFFHRAQPKDSRSSTSDVSHVLRHLVNVTSGKLYLLKESTTGYSMKVPWKNKPGYARIYCPLKSRHLAKLPSLLESLWWQFIFIAAHSGTAPDLTRIESEFVNNGSVRAQQMGVYRLTIDYQYHIRLENLYSWC